ncbi:S41 family peptidase [Tessaracoccus oleiagri]|uniref:Peptidase family S41 n=1 Tax=Tessaracoccus oleiagri TaxID=686624 RepID=A0A1G9JH08_9ACTN|nr:S41 family peptidase [Tessaracoccus oleiagri]SDL36572.1 Peptidase family S41 [Tessaracoccus oleiagri]
MSTGRRLAVIVAGLLLALSLVAGVAWTHLNPHRGQAAVDDSTLPLAQTLTRDEAVGDLDFVARTIRDRHVWAADGLPAPFASAWEEERSALPAQPTVLDVWRASLRMLAALGDGHTFVAVPRLGAAAYGIDYVMADGVLHVDTGSGRSRVETVNGVAVDELIRRNASLTPADNEGWVEGRLIERLGHDDGLALLGAPTAAAGRVEVDLADGSALFGTRAEGSPVTRQIPVAEYRFEGDVGVLTVHRCDPDDSYRATLAAFFDEVARRGVERVVVDLRGNPGGDSRVADLFVGYLDVGTIPSGSSSARYGNWVVPLGSGTMEGRQHHAAHGGEVVVLTDHRTFSSAADFATVLSDNDLATVVGESPGSNPSGAGDVVVFRLPRSGLFLQVSYKEFVRPDPSRGGGALAVDVPADPTGTVEEMLARP